MRIFGQNVLPGKMFRMQQRAENTKGKMGAFLLNTDSWSLVDTISHSTIFPSSSFISIVSFLIYKEIVINRTVERLKSSIQIPINFSMRYWYNRNA